MRNALLPSALYTDLYQLSMGQVYFLSGHHEQHAVFDYFFRKLPYDGGYAVFAGLDDVLQTIGELRFTTDDLEYLKRIGMQDEYLKYLSRFRFTGSLHAVKEGEVIFPNVPVVRVEGRLLEAQLIETVLLNLLNFQSLIATKATRIRDVAGDRTLLDFGLRRAQGLGGYHASRATIIGGFNGSSNVMAGADFGIPVSGTMAHSFIQHFEDEITAFRTFASGRPENCVLLVDTYHTLNSGVPNAITVAKEMEQEGKRLYAIRLDSGDLAYLAKRARHMLNDAGLDYVKIAASNQLDENVIKSLLEQGAPIDIFGVGTNLVTGQPDGALDGVYKLAFSNGKPRIKLSESLSKTTLPDKKQVYRVFDANGMFLGADAVALSNEEPPREMHHPIEPGKSMHIADYKKEPLLELVMKDGERIGERQPLAGLSAYRESRISLLPPEYRRFQNPHTYKVGISSALLNLRNDMRDHYLKKL